MHVVKVQVSDIFGVAATATDITFYIGGVISRYQNVCMWLVVQQHLYSNTLVIIYSMVYGVYPLW